MYEELRFPLARNHNVIRKEIPSYYTLTKHRPVVKGCIMQPSSNIAGPEPTVCTEEFDFKKKFLEIEAKLNKD